MCISNAPAQFNNTKGYIGRTKNNTVVMAYQMDAKVVGDGLRAIILQIPAKRIVKIHDTSAYCNFLNEIAIQSAPFHFSQEGLQDASLMRSSKKAIGPTLEKVGMYDVVVLESYKEFNYIADIFPEDRAPAITKELIDFYSEYYGDWKFIVATFDNKTPMSSQPFMVEYESAINYEDGYTKEFNEAYIFPALDNGDEKGFHSGIPKIGTFIPEDHFLCFPFENGLEVKFSQPVPNDLISNRVGFYQMNGLSINGDFIVFADGRNIKKMPAPALGKAGLHNILHSSKDPKESKAYINW
jgi:hypothetical protein